MGHFLQNLKNKDSSPLTLTPDLVHHFQTLKSFTFLKAQVKPFQMILIKQPVSDSNK